MRGPAEPGRILLWHISYGPAEPSTWMLIDVCIKMCIGMCIDLYIGMGIEMCIGMSTNSCIERIVRTHVSRHVYRHRRSTLQDICESHNYIGHNYIT